MTDRKRNFLYWFFKILSVIVSCALPVWAICERFPIWAESTSKGHSIGVGVVLIIIVLLIIFRKTVFNFITDHFDLKHAPPIVIWMVLLIVSYIMIYIGQFMRDMTSVLWMGLLGCAIGTVLTFISGRFKKKDVTSDG